MNKLRNAALWLSAIVTTGFGLALLIVPDQLMKLYGSTANDAALITAHLFGGVTLALSVLAVLATRVEDATALRAIDGTFLAGYAFIALATVWNIYVYGTLGAAAVTWTTVVGYVLFALAFGYLLFGVDMTSGTSRGRPIT